MERMITAAIATAALAIFAAPTLIAENRQTEETPPNVSEVLVEHLEDAWLRRSHLVQRHP